MATVRCTDVTRGTDRKASNSASIRACETPLPRYSGLHEYTPNPCALFVFAVVTHHADKQAAIERAVNEAIVSTLAEPLGEGIHTPLLVFGHRLSKGLRLGLKGC